MMEFAAAGTEAGTPTTPTDTHVVSKFELENARRSEQTKLIMSLIERTIEISFRQRVYFTRHVFGPNNRLLADVLLDETSKETPKVLIVVDESLHVAQPNLAGNMENYFKLRADRLRLVCPPIILEGGERVKNSYFHVSEIQSFIDRYHMDRHSYVIAVGGGALLDVVGLAAATAHRGMRHVRIPTTTLSQDDSGVGVKNGINAFGKKNFIGTFAVPFAVINDFEMLSSLPPRDKRAGFIEAIKVSLIRDASFFDTIERDALKLREFDPEAMERLIHRCAELHLNHIATSGDPFELGSARPLDFGHWSAHKLEQLSDYRIRHGEAVAIGIALDVVYCRRSGFLDMHEANRIITLIETLGFDLFANELLNVDSAGDFMILKGLEEFREHLGGELTITLLRAIGKGFEVHQVNDAIVVESIQELQERHARKGLKPVREKTGVPSTL
jgi:3-dehydroquinate synthase